jgi:hypothetical protein
MFKSLLQLICNGLLVIGAVYVTLSILIYVFQGILMIF